MMSSASRKILLGVSLAALSSLAASATPVTTSVQLVNSGSPSIIVPTVKIDGVTKHDVYIGPYTVLIDGQDVSALCIDFFDASHVGNTWTAYETTVGSSNLSDTYDPSDGQEYEEEAYLYDQIEQTGANRTGLQEAAWDIMAYGITSSSYKYLIGDNTYIDAALANYSSLDYADYTILSDTTAHGEQEFLINSLTPATPPVSVTPEPPSFYLILAPALLLAFAAFRRQRHGLN